MFFTLFISETSAICYFGESEDDVEHALVNSTLFIGYELVVNYSYLRWHVLNKRKHRELNAGSIEV